MLSYMLNFDLGQSLNCIKTANAAKLQFFRGLIIHFSFLVFCPYKIERANKNLTFLVDIVIYCGFKTSSAFILPF